tara:strand:- start:732 stop:1736 length:1005 start_codon:yes stop_codon:yes gene_type:complete
MVSSINGNVLVISDWNKDLKAYSIPKDIISSIETVIGNNNFKFIDEDFEKDKVTCYFGNIPSQELLLEFKNLKWVHFGSIGIDKLSHDFISKNSLTITNSAKTNHSGVTTYSMGELFRSCKSGFISRVCNDENELNRSYYNKFYDYMIDYSDINLCILGYGDIGKEITKILSPIVNQINVVTRTKRNNFNNVNFYQINNIQNATKDITHVINVLPLHEKTKGIINNKFFQSLDNAYYICAGRAETHVNKDLLDALDNKFLRGASLDVYGLPNGEIQKDFLDNKKIHLSPHISGWTKNFWPNQSKIILYNINMYRENNFNKMKNLLYCKGSKLNE